MLENLRESATKSLRHNMERDDTHLYQYRNVRRLIQEQVSSKLNGNDCGQSVNFTLARRFRFH